MTAVIGIINKAAAAIATDSAVTVTGPKGPKIFNRANKIFQLSKTYPVGLMIYNNGEFMGTPWEVIIKQYRQEQLKDKSFQRLEDYKNDFITYLHSKSFFCDILQQKRVLQYVITDFLKVIAREITEEQNELIQNRPLNLVEQLAGVVVSKIKDSIPGYESITDFSPEMASFTEAELEQFGFMGLRECIESVFNRNGIPVDFDTISGDLKKLTYLILKSKQYFYFFSGLVFCGYGEDEYFPQLIAINISLAIGDRLRYFNDERGSAQVSHTNSSSIRPFAQTDVIDTILSGIDPGLGNLYFAQFESFIQKNNELIARSIENISPELAQAVRSINPAELSSELQKHINTERIRYYMNPLMNAVGTLSKEDLAEMAESLVYLTYLKRRFTFAEESVGGPVDVAIITKGDGFIWIKRKHYFTKELNPHYFKNH